MLQSTLKENSDSVANTSDALYFLEKPFKIKENSTLFDTGNWRLNICKSRLKTVLYELNKIKSIYWKFYEFTRSFTESIP